MGAATTINRVRLNWENGNVDNILFNPIEARYVKVTGTKRNTQYGYSLWEMEVYS